MKKLLPETGIIFAILMVISYGFAQTWMQTSAPHFAVFSITSSAGGKTIMAAGSGVPFVSTNSGITWTTNAAPVINFGYCVASSADGTKMVGSFNVQGFNIFVFVSTNSGNTWIQTGLPQGDWSSCASSADGTKLVAAIPGGLIYTSTNSGTTWQTNNAPTKSWASLASSADGTKLAAAAYNDKIYTSTSSGLTWTPTSAPSSPWGSIASSADGSHLVATGGGGTYISTNSGGSWAPSSIIGSSVASSADGSKLIICNSGAIYTSTNFGINWMTNSVPGSLWECVASSADGDELLAGDGQGGNGHGGNGNGGIWIYQATPSPQLNIAPSGNNLVLSWLVPSTNFALQQNLDLSTTDWLTLTNSPALNLTNLNNELVLSPTNSSDFFRLISQ